MRWLRRMRWRERDISRSMVALVASLAALALLGLVTNLPGWLGHGDGFVDVSPGLLKVDPGAKGVATLGGGVNVSLYSDGLRISRDNDLLLQTVIGGPCCPRSRAARRTTVPVGPGRRVTASYDNVTITELLFLPGRATLLRHGPGREAVAPTHPAHRVGWWGGPDRGLGERRRRRGLAPQPRAPDRRASGQPFPPSTSATPRHGWTPVRSRAGPPSPPSSAPTSGWVRSASLAASTSGPQGRTDIHIWSDSCSLTVSSQARPEPPPRSAPA